MIWDDDIVQATTGNGNQYAIVSASNLSAVSELGNPFNAESDLEYNQIISELSINDWLIHDIWKLENPTNSYDPSAPEALSAVYEYLKGGRLLIFKVDSELVDEAASGTSMDAATQSDGQAVTQTVRKNEGQSPSGQSNGGQQVRNSETETPAEEPLKEIGTTTPGRVYGSSEGEDGVWDGTVNNVYVDPNTADKAKEKWRKPVTKGKLVTPYAETRPEDTKITIINYPYRDKTRVMKTKGRAAAKLTRDSNGFPIFTTFDTYISDDHIGSEDSGGHFEAAAKNLLAVIDKDPSLAKKMGLSELNLTELRENPESSPTGFVWHHHQDVGRMQLVQKDIHDDHRHTGGMAIWGGGHN